MLIANDDTDTVDADENDIDEVRCIDVFYLDIHSSFAFNI
jgi:hypothetical protein